MKRTNSFFSKILNMVSNKLQNKHIVLYNELPAKVKVFACKYFPHLSIAFIEKNGMAYTLTFNNDTKVTVNEDGTWKKIDYSQEAALVSLLPNNIKENINTYFTNAKIVRAKRSAEGYIVELTNSICMKYDNKGLVA